MKEGKSNCPICHRETEHHIVRAGSSPLVRCLVCGEVHPKPPERKRISAVRVILSSGEGSRVCNLYLPAHEELFVGQKLELEEGICPKVRVEVTSLETYRRVSRATVDEIRTLWARDLGQAEVKISISRGSKTRSISIKTPGNALFFMGQRLKVGGLNLEVIKIKARKGGFLREVEASNIIRIWARDI